MSDLNRDPDQLLTMQACHARVEPNAESIELVIDVVHDETRHAWTQKITVPMHQAIGLREILDHVIGDRDG